MKIKLSSVFVDDQDKALKFYTEVLGFVKKTEIALAGVYKMEGAKAGKYQVRTLACERPMDQVLPVRQLKGLLFSHVHNPHAGCDTHGSAAGPGRRQ